MRCINHSHIVLLFQTSAAEAEGEETKNGVDKEVDGLAVKRPAEEKEVFICI